MFDLKTPTKADDQALASNPFSAGAAYCDDEYVPVAEARMPLLDWGFIRGDANQDTVSVWNGQFFRLDDHLDRFFRNIKDLRMECPLSREQVKEVAFELVRRTGLKEAYLQMNITRGMPPIGSRDPRTSKNVFRAYCIPYVWIATPEQQRTGLSMHISERWRVPPQAVSTRLKHYHWLDFEMSLFDAYDRGLDTACCINERGNVAEGPGFNLFAVFDGVVTTPEHGVLDGMTRRTVRELCDEMSIPHTFGEFSPERLKAEASEVFVSSTSGGVIPITNVDGQPIGDGSPGPITQRVHRAYWSKREDGWLATPAIYD